MWMAILSFLGGPVIKGLIDAYQAKLKAGNVESKIAADLAAGEIAAEVPNPTRFCSIASPKSGAGMSPTS